MNFPPNLTAGTEGGARFALRAERGGIVQLRDYQSEAVGQCADLLRRRRHTLLCLPTGGGKTVCAVATAQAVGGRTAVLTNRRELKGQAERAGLTNVLSWQQVARNPAPQPDVDLLVVDEAHFAPTGGPMEAAVRSFPNAARFGLTATPCRGDGRPLGDLFDEIVVGVRASTLIARGHLVNCRVFRPSEELDGLAKRPVDEYLLRSPGRRAVVFCGSTEDGTKCAEEFQAAGFRAAFVGQGTSERDRDARVAALASGDLDVLVNVFVLTAGWDCPPCEVAILARGFEHVGAYIQACGRVLRPAPGKAEAMILDLRGVSWRHGSPVQDREYSLQGKPIKACGEPLRMCPRCGWTYEPGPARCPSCEYRPTADEIRRQRVLGVATEEARELRPADPAELDRLLRLAGERGYSAEWAVRAYRKTHSKLTAWPSQLYGQVVASLRKGGASRKEAHARARKALL